MMAIHKGLVIIAIPMVIAVLFASYTYYENHQQQQLEQVEADINRCIEAHAKLADNVDQHAVKAGEGNETNQLILGDTNPLSLELDALGNPQSKTMDAALNKALSKAWISQKNSREECMAKVAK